MPDTGQERLITWLNDAYVMEHKLAEVLQEHASQSSEHPKIADKINEHRELTLNHAERVKTCIEQLGGSAADFQSTARKLWEQWKA